LNSLSFPQEYWTIKLTIIAIKNLNQVSDTGSIKLAESFSAIGAMPQKKTAVETKKSPNRKLYDTKASSKNYLFILSSIKL
jgi:hypothetical protein